MAQKQEAYLCPMHPEVRQPGGGKCPRCGMALVPEGARFALFRHLASHPWMLAGMAAAMLAIMAAIMMF
jgi:Heavy metal binding domain